MTEAKKQKLLSLFIDAVGNYEQAEKMVIDERSTNFSRDLDELKKECLEMIDIEDFDLILMDIMMPVMSGETALKELKKDPNFDTPVIALTADVVNGSDDRYIKEGFTDYIPKPFTKEQIYKKLAKIFKN